MELLLKRNENPGTFGTRYDLFAKLELNPDELALIRKATPNKTYIVEDEYGKNNFRWILMLIPSGIAALIAGIITMFYINLFLALPVVSGCVNVYLNGQFENAAFFRHKTCTALTL
jgi:hypothetical protein